MAATSEKTGRISLEILSNEENDSLLSVHEAEEGRFSMKPRSSRTHLAILYSTNMLSLILIILITTSAVFRARDPSLEGVYCE